MNKQQLAYEIIRFKKVVKDMMIPFFINNKPYKEILEKLDTMQEYLEKDWEYDYLKQLNECKRLFADIFIYNKMLKRSESE